MAFKFKELGYGTVNQTRQKSNRPDLNERRRVEQSCKDYWRNRYGKSAEVASRGGMTWYWSIYER